MNLEVSGLTRHYGDLTAVDDATFTVEGGRLTGFVGANGAGKTTAMRMIMGLLEPSSGEVKAANQPLNQEVRRRFGYMPEERGLYPKMPLRDQVAYFGTLHGLSKQRALENTDRLLTTLNLSDRAKDPIEKLSLGNQQRAQIAVALVHQPDALILDEPFSGLDPLAVDTIVDVLKGHAKRGIPILLSSHQLDVVERLCDDIVIISDGKIVASGGIEELRAKHSQNLFHISSTSDLAWLESHPGVETVTITPLPGGRGDRATMRIQEQDQEAMVQGVLQVAARRGPVLEFGPVTTPLTEVFREYTAPNLKHAASEQEVH